MNNDSLNSGLNGNKDISGFRKFKNSFFPVENHELKKFLPMAAMIMLIIFVYHMVRSLKDAIVIPVLGAELISALKLYGVLPFAILFMLIYSRLTSVFSREALFYGILTYFLLFFSLFAFVMFPAHEMLHPDLSRWTSAFPKLRYIIMMLQNWTFTLFFIHAEMWGSMMLSLMFWQFANNVTKVNEAKRFYSLFSVIGQVGMIIAGIVVTDLSRKAKLLPEAERWGITLNWMTIASIIAGIATMAIYYWLNNYVLTDPRYYDPSKSAAATKKKKAKLSMSESLKYVFTSKYIGLIALLVICYGTTINLAEGVWKKHMGLLFPDRNDYSIAQGQVQIYMGVTSLFVVLVAVNVTQKFSWFVAAIITPVITLISGVLFFIFILAKEPLTPVLMAMNTTPLMMAVIFGAAQNIVSKSSKYTLFDPTKETAYIPLDEELKTKGKAAVDVVGSRLGKSLGAIIQQALLTFVAADLFSLVMEISVIFVTMMLLWIYAVFALSKEFEKVKHLNQD